MDYTTLFLVVALPVAQSVALSPAVTSIRSVAEQSPTAAAAAASALDYEVFKTKVQPILTSARKGNARCIACHSRGGGNAYLEPLPPGTLTYTEEQSRRNFERVSRLVVPGDPLKSVLLINPLATAAGGSHWHGGGKHWQSQDNPEWQTLSSWVRTRPAAAASSTSSAAARPALNFDEFKAKVQPILTSARKGNARCIACHSRGGGNAYLEPLPPGSTTYSDEQSRRNFERVSRLVVPGDPLKSVLLINPLATEAGGSHWHGGGKHWQSQQNAEWQTLATWVRGN
jgi:cytochrome c553